MSRSRKKYSLADTGGGYNSLPQTCYACGKLCLSESEANARINGTRNRQHYIHSKVIPKRAYRCPDCGCWHLTSTPKYDDYASDWD